MLALVDGYGVGPIAMGVFFLLHVVLHLLQAWWTGTGVDADSRVSR